MIGRLLTLNAKTFCKRMKQQRFFRKGRWLLLLCCVANQLFAAEFKLQPRLCLHYPQQPCALQVKVSWQQQVPACLYQKSSAKPLLCGNGAEQPLQLTLAGHTRLELRAQQGGALLDSRLVRVLQVDLNAGDQLLKRSRASWGTP
jgi:hypothetical protein